MIKCYGCSDKTNHKFSDCLSVTCGCACVGQLRSIEVNQLIDDVSDSIPNFLKIEKDEMKLLPDLTKAVTSFNKINRHEWLPIKKDRRFKRKKR